MITLSNAKLSATDLESRALNLWSHQANTKLQITKNFKFVNANKCNNAKTEWKNPIQSQYVKTSYTQQSMAIL